MIRGVLLHSCCLLIALLMVGCVQKVKNTEVVQITPTPKGFWYVSGGDIYFCKTDTIGNYCSKFPKEYYNDLFRRLRNGPR